MFRAESENMCCQFRSIYPIGFAGGVADSGILLGKESGADNTDCQFQLRNEFVGGQFRW
jgi:hypothetical protein